MANLKKNNNKKITNFSNQELEEYPIFCFKYLTTNNKYNFEYFNIINEKNKAKCIIFDKLIELQQKTWKQLVLERKNIGFETLPNNQIRFSPNNLQMTKDTKILSFRLNSQNWRLLGVRSEHFKSVLHIIGFDFDFSAYKH